MTVETATLEYPLYPQPDFYPNDPVQWSKDFLATLQSQQISLIDATRTQLVQLQDDYASADAFLTATFESEISTITTDVAAVAARTTTLESQMNTPTTGVLARITTAETAIATNTGAISTLSTTVSAHTVSISSLVSDVSGLDGDVATINSTLVTMDAAITTNASAITTLNSSVSSLTSTVSAQGTTITGLSGDLTDLSGDVSTLSATVTTTATAVIDLGDDLDALDDRVSAYYGISVDAGTNVATLVLLASGGGSPASQIILNAANIILEAEAINFGSSTFFEDTEHTFYTESAGKRYRWSGPFGASDDLLVWFGPTSVSLGSETATNGYWAQATDGKVYYGGAELSGAAAAFDAYISAETNGVFVSAPGTSNVSATVSGTGGTAPYTYLWEIDGASDGWGASGQTTDTLSLSKFFSVAGGGGETWVCTVTDSVGRQRQVGYIFVGGAV